MFRNLIPALADQFYPVAPDYPGFGSSSMPSASEFVYSFDNLAEGLLGWIRAVSLTFASINRVAEMARIGFMEKRDKGQGKKNATRFIGDPPCNGSCFFPGNYIFKYAIQLCKSIWHTFLTSFPELRK